MSKGVTDAKTANSIRQLFYEWYVCTLTRSGPYERYNVDCIGPIPSGDIANASHNLPPTKICSVFAWQPSALKIFNLQREMFDTYLVGDIKLRVPSATKNSQ